MENCCFHFCARQNQERNLREVSEAVPQPSAASAARNLKGEIGLPKGTAASGISAKLRNLRVPVLRVMSTVVIQVATVVVAFFILFIAILPPLENRTNLMLLRLVFLKSLGPPPIEGRNLAKRPAKASARKWGAQSGSAAQIAMASTRPCVFHVASLVCFAVQLKRFTRQCGVRKRHQSMVM